MVGLGVLMGGAELSSGQTKWFLFAVMSFCLSNKMKQWASTTYSYPGETLILTFSPVISDPLGL